LELNVYFIAADPDEIADAVENRYVELVQAVRAEITIPLAVKIGPFFSSVGHMAHRLVACNPSLGSGYYPRRGRCRVPPAISAV
jgi:dihydroorotate dehydrogenase